MNTNSLKKEADYFTQLIYEALKTIEEERQKKLVEEEMRGLKELHYMRCPKCGMHLKEIDYEGVKADKCMQCEGIWLDGGVLEAVPRLEKSVINKFFSAFEK